MKYRIMMWLFVAIVVCPLGGPVNAATYVFGDINGDVDTYLTMEFHAGYPSSPTPFGPHSVEKMEVFITGVLRQTFFLTPGAVLEVVGFSDGINCAISEVTAHSADGLGGVVLGDVQSIRFMSNPAGNDGIFSSVGVAEVPIPSTFLLFGAGLAGLAGLRKKFKR